MQNDVNHLISAIDVELELGIKYFYRQRIYRMAEANKFASFTLRGQTCYLGSHVLKAFLSDLESRIALKFPELQMSSLRIFYDAISGKKITVDGLFGRGISINTDEETEEDLLLKIKHILEWIKVDNQIDPQLTVLPDEASEESEVVTAPSDVKLVRVLPEEIAWIRVSENRIQDVDIKSYFLVSIPSVAQFIGVKSDTLTEWIINSTFKDATLSLHYKQIQAPGKAGAWKKGVINGLTPYVPFELIPEIIVAVKQSKINPAYPEKAEMLYNLARKTLLAVGLAVSGNKDIAAQELARVGKDLGLTAADQIIAIFKQYESRDFQIKTTKEYNSKIKEIGADYAITTGMLTFGITRRTASQWKAFGSSRNLPKKLLSSSREVMRTLSPSDSVGMTFGEKHFVKDPNVEEAVKTGSQLKESYERLKKVGLLEDTTTDK